MEVQTANTLNCLIKPCDNNNFGLIEVSSPNEASSNTNISSTSNSLTRYIKLNTLKEDTRTASFRLKSRNEPKLLSYLLNNSSPSYSEMLSLQLTDQISDLAEMSTFPRNASGIVKINLQDRIQWGTGVLIGKDLVLTSAHVLYDLKNNTKRKHPISSIQFVPSANGRFAPFDTCKVIDAYIPKAFESSGVYEDYAILLLDRDVGTETGFIELGLANNTFLRGENVIIAGYVGDKPQYLRHVVMKGKIANVTDDMLDYKISTQTGQSGSGIFLYDPQTQQYSLIGVHSWGRNGSGSGYRITPERLKRIKNWELKARNKTYDLSFDDWNQTGYEDIEKYGDFIQQSNIASLEHIDNWRWHEATTTGIPYCIDAAIVDIQLRNNIEAAIVEFIEAGIKFTKLPRQNENCETELSHIHFYLNDWSDSPMSGIGRTAEGSTPITLPLKSSVFAVMHEIMHTLGFVHEHQRHDRDFYVEVDRKLVESRDPDYIIEPKFYPIGSYDPESIMHYHWINGEMHAREGGPISEQQREKLKVREREPKLSKGDLEGLKLVYGLCGSQKLGLCSSNPQDYHK